MNHKELNIYQRAYKAAIDLNLWLNGDGAKYSVEPQDAERMRRISREVLSDLAEGVNQPAPQGKKMFNLKAINECRDMLMELETLQCAGLIPDDEHRYFSDEYSKVAQMLGGEDIGKAKRLRHPTIKP